MKTGQGVENTISVRRGRAYFGGIAGERIASAEHRGVDSFSGWEAESRLASAGGSVENSFDGKLGR